MSQVGLLCFPLEPGAVACWTVILGGHLVLEVLRKDWFQSPGGGNSGFYNSDLLSTLSLESSEAPLLVNLSISISPQVPLIPFLGDNMVSIHFKKNIF